MNKKIIFIVAAFIVVALFGVVSATMYNQGNDGNTDIKVSNDGKIQDVKLSFRNYEYVLEPSTLTRGVPVRMEVDLNTVTGCMKDIVIPSFGVRKYVSPGNNIIEFTPTKSGTFNIACSMNMGRGKFTVVEPDGSSSDYVEAQFQAGGSCGAGGGCGCGGARR